MAPYLDPEWLEVEKFLGGRILLGGSMEKYKDGGKVIEQYIRAHLPPPHKHDGLDVVDETINENLSVRVYKPKVEGMLPVGVFCHGGGFSSGSIDMEDAPTVDIKVVYQDAFDGFSWAYENSPKLGGDQTKVFMMGSSCGGTLSLATAHKLIALGRKGQLKGVINMAGGTVCEDYIPPHVQHLMKSMEENSVDVPIIDRETTRMINDVTGLDKLAKDEWMFPLLSSHLAEFPSVYLVACGVDPLRDDNVAMEHELRAKGVEVKMDTYEGLPHVFWMFPNLKATRLFIENLLAGIKFILG